MDELFNAKNFINAKHKNCNINYDRILQNMVKSWQEHGFRPKIMIHSCCAPCSTVVLEYLADVADVTIYFSNSNIHPKSEYDYRKQVQEDFIIQFNQRTNHTVQFLADEYNPKRFLEMAKGMEDEVEGGKRCHACYDMRLSRAAEKAKELDFDYFASALTLSPHKNSQIINDVGFNIETFLTVHYLPSDFKKNNGYRRSVDMCKEYDIYRQCYCGCVFAAKQQGVDLKAVNQHAREQLEKHRQNIPFYFIKQNDND
ncbi:DNA integration/recombination/inversion protein [Granulicatella sp. zg-ZJ]|uniref:epoxyqueuosine reductase QueH n=1 Tax=unclassified Granulicatella TaxID=2630493 RepID=UPI0013BFB9F6|nr:MULTISPECIES: epoxyqueuosine reductase QueH [unclassified Granulicatella]MBS4749908.1 epoxyqueuosine reductase QueH [Carnobacteriaceae bacterium zg-ZUI78]NEW62094.1 DNA integration/recombination/inversion protein [Granulicatella sp. zg-ZJ]NEW66399.1 DNA integration/recombination/inversion protein [Granulicatella sp. zg-84]QMI86135.1 epoxyqueuosine reductase QueH [Carnobacteriaceae bacterium zg-84]